MWHRVDIYTVPHPRRLLSSEAFIFTELRVKEVFSTAEVLAAVGNGCTADILKEVEGLCTWIGIRVTGDGTNVLL
jgi:hypothetical protein